VLTRDVREISLTKEKSETDPCLRLWINCQHSTTILSLLFISTSASILTGSNDLSTTCPTQTHFDIRDPSFWKSQRTKYTGIITEPPQDANLIQTIITNCFAFGSSFCALLLSSVDYMIPIMHNRPPSLIVYIDGLPQTLFLWLNPTLVGTRLLSLRGDILSTWHSKSSLFGEMIKAEITRAVQATSGNTVVVNTETYASSTIDVQSTFYTAATSRAPEAGLAACSLQTEAGVVLSSEKSKRKSDNDDEKEDDSSIDPITLRAIDGNYAAKQGQALQESIKKYSNILSKHEVITKVCKTKYRSGQRKIRIAKYLGTYPEISTMTQRQAEQYLSQKIKPKRKNLNVTKRRNLDKQESNTPAFKIV
jgi:hypothetical protein